LSGIQVQALPGVNNALAKGAPKLDFAHVGDYPFDDAPSDRFSRRAPEIDSTENEGYPFNYPGNDAPKNSLDSYYYYHYYYYYYYCACCERVRREH
jgi:hypothetical protein